MRIVQVDGSSVTTAPRRRATDPIEADAVQSGTRALIALEAAVPIERAPRLAGRPEAPFLAQLIATQMQAPQTRARMRAEPEEGVAAYRAMPKPQARKRNFGSRV